MDNEQLHELVTQILSQVLEDFGFMFVDPPPDEPVPAPAQALAAAEKFLGEVNGTVRLAAPVEFCAGLAANVLGLDSPDDPEAAKFAQDCMKELVNVFGGQLTTAMFGADAVFDFTMPEAREFDAAAWTAMQADPRTVEVSVECMPLLIQVEA